MRNDNAGGAARRKAANFLGTILLAAFALAFASPALALTPSPVWRDQVIYQIVTDRFFNGDPANDAVEGAYNPADGYRTHGGDFKGIQAKLDYLQQLGVTALWISPVVINTGGEYHGYAAKDLYTIAPHMGTKAELQSLVAACHARGMYIVIDVVCNHMGTLLTSTDPGYAGYNYPGGYNMSWRNAGNQYPGFFNDISKFHHYGDVGNWSGTEQVVGAIFGLNDIKTEDPAVQAELVAAYTQLIADTDCDGYRVDTVKHVEPGFWDAWCPGVHDWAAVAGKGDFLMFGEVFDGDGVAGPFTGTIAGGNYRFDSMLWYGMYYTTNWVWGGNGAPNDLVNTYGNLSLFDPTVRDRLVTFLDNHDNSRFQGAGIANQDQGRARAALSWLLTSRAIPCLYYGTEQDFDGGGDPWCREDMWAGQWNFGPSLGDNFRETHSLFRWTQSLLSARGRHEALRRGTITHLYAEGAAPGAYVFRREAPTDSVVVAINSANAPVTLNVNTLWPAGTVLGDAVDPALFDTVGVGGALSVRLPARGSRLYESLSSRATPLAATYDRLTVQTTFPGHDQSLNDLRSPLHVVFDRDVDPVTLNSSFHISPAVSGAWTVSGREARFFPGAPWPSGQIVNWGFGSSLVGLDGRPMRAAFDARFRTTAYASGITVTSGFSADRIARQNFGAPLAVLSAPFVGPDMMLIADSNKDRVFTLTPGSDFGHFLGDSRWRRAAGLARAADGRTVIADTMGLYQIDARLQVVSLAGPSSASRFGAIAFGGEEFGNSLFVSDASGNRLTKLGAANTLVSFATGINGAFGMAFGPGGAWGTSLYVSDPSLTGSDAALDGARRIVRVSAAGVVSAFVTDAVALRGAGALAFDRTGKFGGDLFVADLISERVLRVTSAGAISVFASGFVNLSGPQCIAFGPDGALYVCDSGNSDWFTRPAGNLPPGQVIRIAPNVLTTDVAPGHAGATLELSAPTPNPSGGDAALRFVLARGAATRLTVLDLAGRRVRTLADRSFAAGEHVLRWDGRDEQGRAVEAGMYFVRLESAGESRTARAVRLR
ncbi:MAG: hypothetical protein IT348_20175 [Candidatus Eisenbacteria bacterium]|nr:hypothetical protein [Candidatus Eisenbacteria bacterium]